MDTDFEKPVSITLKRDEAIVLLWYLTREVRNEDMRHLEDSFADPAEPHALQGLLQELILPLQNSGTSTANGAEILARKHLLKRHT